MNNSKREAFSNQELDQMAAEKIDKTKSCDYLISNDGGESLRMSFIYKSEADIYLENEKAQNPKWWEGYEVVQSFYYKDWNPTEPDSNQCERYLFPKLREKGCWIDITYSSKSFNNFTIKISLPEKWRVKSNQGKDPDQINRTKVICFLEAMEKTNEI